MVYILLFYIVTIVSPLIYLEGKMNKYSFKINVRHLPILLIIGFSGALFNLFMKFGYQTAPNPGYINAVNAASITLVTILSAVIFKDELNIQKIIGILGVSLGLILLFI